jgi:hypothetical protein
VLCDDWSCAAFSLFFLFTLVFRQRYGSAPWF